MPYILDFSRIFQRQTYILIVDVNQAMRLNIQLVIKLNMRGVVFNITMQLHNMCIILHVSPAVHLFKM